MADKASKTPTLDVRIADVLKAKCTADRNSLFSLWEEAFEKINELQETIKTEEDRVLDLTNTDPDKSTATITSIKLQIERLTKAITEELKPRVLALDAEKARTDWNAEAEKRRAVNDELYEELKALYPPFFQQIVKLYVRILENDIEIGKLKARAPACVDKQFVAVEPHSLFWALINLPSWDKGVTFPPRKSPADIAWQNQVAITNAAVAQAKAIEAKHAQMFSPDWAAVHDEIHKRKAEEDEKAEAELKAKDLEARQNYYLSLQEAERKRIRGEI